MESKQGMGAPGQQKTVAIMQPYFLPYAGYFRLFASSDLFVIYDCVQFPRRGWVHRNRLPDALGREVWLTLRLKKAPADVLIRNLQFSPDAAQSMAEQLRRFPAFAGLSPEAASIKEALLEVRGTPVDYIERLLHRVSAYLGLPWNVVRSSSLDIPPTLRGEARILELVRRTGGGEYVNAPGGRELYSEDAFRQAGVALRFLPSYPGSKLSILARIAMESQEDLRRDIINAVGA